MILAQLRVGRVRNSAEVESLDAGNSPHALSLGARAPSPGESGERVDSFPCARAPEIASHECADAMTAATNIARRSAVNFPLAGD
jgi:hypothetical protein